MADELGAGYGRGMRVAVGLLIAVGFAAIVALCWLLLGKKAAASPVCTINWTGGAGNQQWTSPANWDLDRIPGSSDFVCIPSGGGTVHYNATSSVTGLKDADNSWFEIDSGALTLSGQGPSSVVALQTNGGALTVASGATLSLGRGALNGGGLLDQGTLIVTGAGISTGGGVTLEDAGTLRVQSSNATFDGSGTYQIDTGAVFLADGAAGAGNVTFNQSINVLNAGAFRATNGAAVEISLSGGTYSGFLQPSAVLTANTNASIDLLNGYYVFQTGALVTGDGVHIDANGYLQGASTSSVLVVTGTVTQGNAPLGYSPGAGGFAGPGIVRIATTGRLELPQGGAFNDCTSTITCTQAHLINKGTIDWTGGSYGLYTGGVLENDGTFNMAVHNQSIGGCCGTGPGLIRNDAAGMIIGSASSSTPTIGAPVANSGTIRSTGGADLYFNCGCSSTLGSTGILTADGGGSLDLSNGAWVFQTGAAVSGNGVHVDVNGLFQGANAASGLTVSGTITQGNPASGIGPGGFAGPGTVTIASSGVLAIPGGGSLNPCSSTISCESAHVVNDGKVSWTGGSYSINANGVLENAGTVAAQADNQTLGGPGLLQNDANGTIVKSGGSAPTKLSVPVINSGTIKATAAGDLALTGSDTEGSSGVLTGSGAGSAVELSAGMQTYTTGSTVTGTAVLLDGASLTGSTSTSTLAITGTMTWSAGRPDSQGTVTIAHGARVNVTATVSMNSADLANYGTLAFQDAGGGFVLDAPATLENFGTMIVPDHWNAGTSGGCCPAGTVTNESGGTIEKIGGSSLSTFGVVVQNDGKLLVSGGAQLSTPALANFNTADATLTGGTYQATTSGVLYLPCGPGQESVAADRAAIVLGPQGDVDGCGNSDPLEASLTSIGSGGSLTLLSSTTFGPVSHAVTSAGTIHVPAQSTLTFGNGLTETAGAVRVDGTLSSAVQVSGGSLTGSGAVHGSVTASGGTVVPEVSQTLAISSALTVTGAHLTVPAGTTLSVGGGFTESAGTVRVDGALAVTPTTVSMSGGTFTGSTSITASVSATGGTIAPEAMKTLAFTGSVSSGGAHLNVPAGATLTSGGGITQTTGTLRVDGTLSSTGGPVAISGGFVDGVGTVGGSLTTTGGTVSPGDPAAPGTLNVTGNYMQSSAAKLAELIKGPAAGAGYSQLAATGSATIAGTLAVTTDASFTPTPGQVFAMVTASTVSGTWNTFTGEFVNPGLGYRTEYDASDFSLLAAAATDMAASISEQSSPNPDATTGHHVTYTVTATDAGPNDASSVHVVDTLPTGTAFVSATASQGSCSHSSGQVTCALGSVASGADATATIVVTPSAAGSITDSATVSSALLEYNPANNSATQATTVYNPSFTLSTNSGPTGTVVTVSGSGYAPGETATPSFTDNANKTTKYTNVTVGGTGHYTTNITIPSGAASGLGKVTVKGSGTGSLTASFTVVPPTISVSPTSGPGGTSVTVSGGGFVSGDTLTPAFTDANSTKTTYPAVNAASDGTFSATITIPASAAQGAGTVSVASGASGNFSTPFTVTVSSADLAVDVNNPFSCGVCLPWNTGQNGTYTVTVTNHGPSGAMSINMSDQVPADTTFVSVNQSSGPTFGCSTGGTPKTTSCTISNFAANASAVFQLTYNLTSCPSQGLVGDTATVSSSTNDPNATNNSKTSTALCQ